MILPPPPKNPDDIPRYLAVIIPVIQQFFADQEVDSVKYTALHVEPDKIEDGLTVRADGTDWNPGSGEGLYMYYNSTWNKL
jgi:hypothetical protein